MDLTKAKEAAEIIHEMNRVKKNLRAFESLQIETSGRQFVMDGNSSECAAAVVQLIRADLESQLPRLEEKLSNL